MTTTDSNLWGGASGHTYTLTPRPDGTTDVDAVVVRQGKNLKGRLFEILLAIGGKHVLGKALATTVKAIETRNYPAGAEGSSHDLRAHYDVFVNDPPPQEGFFRTGSRSGSRRWPAR